MTQTFREFYNQNLLETPLPDDWDDAVFNERIPFAKRVKYAKERSARLGAGSSRVAFEIPFEGRRTVLKIAKNVKGMAQNEAEAEMLNDYYLRGLDITIPMIDYDEANGRPTWIHTEFANKAKDSDFIKACGGTLNDLLAHALRASGKAGDRGHYSTGNADKIDDENELAYGLTNLIGNYDIPSGDFSRLANWGIYQGSPVIIDLGLSSDVMQQHYS